MSVPVKSSCPGGDTACFVIMDQHTAAAPLRAQATENRYQHAMEALWRRMMEIMEVWSQEQKQRQTALKEEYSAARKKVASLLKQKAALVQQNAKMAMELESRKKKQERLEAEAGELKSFLAVRKKELEASRREAQDLKERKESEASGLRKELEEKRKLLVEYQDKIYYLKDKVQKSAQQLAGEKASVEEERRRGTVVASQQSGEIKKMSVEISKLKTQLESSNCALAPTKEESKKFEVMLKSTQMTAQEQITSLKKNHRSIVEGLEKRIKDLEKELRRVRKECSTETARLSEQLRRVRVRQSSAEKESEEDDGLNARARILQYENQQENVN